MNNINAIGIDGSIYCRNNIIGYWLVIPNNLYTCDITKPFVFKEKGESAHKTFDIITIWEVFEHIRKDDINGVLRNINVHLDAKGYFIGSYFSWSMLPRMVSLTI